MSDKFDKDDAAAFAGIGCGLVFLVIQIGIPILVFVVLCMIVFRGCARMFS